MKDAAFSRNFNNTDITAQIQFMDSYFFLDFASLIEDFERAKYRPNSVRQFPMFPRKLSASAIDSELIVLVGYSVFRRYEVFEKVMFRKDNGNFSSVSRLEFLPLVTKSSRR